MPISDLILNNREILPISLLKFGVVITEEEAIKFLRERYNVRTVPRKENEQTQYYLEVCVGSYQRASIDLAALEWAGLADVVIAPVPWRVGDRSGTKAFVRSVNIHHD